MAGESLQQKQRRRQKAVKEPVSASRVIKNQLYGTGWSGKLSVEEKNMATGLLDDAAAMYSLQISRDREVDPPSLHNAILWEHHQLADQTIVYTPALVWEQHETFNDQKIVTGMVYSVPFFSSDKDIWREAFKQVAKQDDGSLTIDIHEFFSYIRDREFTVWPVLVDSFWVTIIMRVEPMDTQEFERVGSTNYYYDRNVSSFAIVDPAYEDSENRRDLVFRRLRRLLQHGAIRLPGDSVVSTLSCDQVGSDWETGHMSYAVSREFLRRLKVLIHRRERDVSGKPDSESERALLWSPIEEAPRIDSYRESLVGACSNYVIELSGYRVRSALEVPSAAADHHPQNLQPEDKSTSATNEKINIGDQTRRFKLKMNLPEGFNRETSADLSQKSEPDVDEESGSEDVNTENENEDNGVGSSSDSELPDKDDKITARQPSPDSQPDTPNDKDEEPRENELAEESEPHIKDGSREDTRPSTPKFTPTPSNSGSSSPDHNTTSPTRPFSSHYDISGSLKGASEEQKLRDVASAAESLSQELEASKDLSGEVILSDAQLEPSTNATDPAPVPAWSSHWSFGDTVADTGKSDNDAARPEAEIATLPQSLQTEGVSVEENAEHMYTTETSEGPSSEQATARGQEGQIPRDEDVPTSTLRNETDIDHPDTEDREVEVTKSHESQRPNQNYIPEDGKLSDNLSGKAVDDEAASQHDDIEVNNKDSGDSLNEDKVGNKEPVNMFDPSTGNDSPGSESDAFISEDVAEDYVVSKDENDAVEDTQVRFEEAPTQGGKDEDNFKNEQSTNPKNTPLPIIEEAESESNTEMEEVPTIQEETAEGDRPVAQPAVSTLAGPGAIPGLSLNQPTTTEKRGHEDETAELPSTKRLKADSPEPETNS